MVKIRLRRVGAKGQPSYRVVVADSRSPRDGRFIETIGHYNPRTDPPTVHINEARALYWLLQGAQPSDPVARMLERRGTLERLAQVKAGASLEEVLAAAEAELAEVEEVPAAAPLAEMPVKEMGLSTKVTNVLVKAGITTVGQLMEKMEEGEKEVLAIPGLGPKSLAEIKQQLASLE